MSAFYKVMQCYFIGMTDRFITTYVKFIQDSVPDIVKIGLFLTELFKN